MLKSVEVFVVVIRRHCAFGSLGVRCLKVVLRVPSNFGGFLARQGTEDIWVQPGGELRHDGVVPCTHLYSVKGRVDR